MYGWTDGRVDGHELKLNWRSEIHNTSELTLHKTWILIFILQLTSCIIPNKSLLTLGISFLTFKNSPLREKMRLKV